MLETLAFVCAYIRRNGYPPLNRELAEALGISAGAASNRMQRLEDAGWIRRGKGLRKLTVVYQPQ